MTIAAPAPAPTSPALTPRKIRPGIEVLGRPARAFAIALALTIAAFALTPLSGTSGFVICVYFGFLAIYAGEMLRERGAEAGKDVVATLLIATCGLFTIIPLALIVVFVVSKGLDGLSMNFFTETMETVGPLDPPTAGGAQHAIIGTLQQVGLAALIATPLGVLTAIHLAESRGRMARVVRVLVEAMSGIPSIVAGLFIYTMWVYKLGKGFSGFAAAMALAVLMLPTVARTAEEVIRLVPGGLREASLALGAPQWRTMLRVVIPAARSGIVTAVVLGIARVAGETAPLLATAFGTDSENTNPFTDPQSALPLFTYQRVRNAVPAQVARGWAAALVLIGIVITLFAIARVIGARGRPKGSR